MRTDVFAAACVSGGALLAAASIAIAAPMMTAPSDLPGQDLSDRGAHRIDDMARYMHVPNDFGYGPGVARPTATVRAATMQAATVGGVPPGDATAGVAGHFDPPVSWPIIGLHEILLPDGRVLNYGTNTTAINTLNYDVWTPSLGFGSDAHNILPNGTNTDIFCSFQSMIWKTGEVLITGGDLDTYGKYRTNNSNNHVTIFSPTKNAIRIAGKMAYPRWYPSIVAMPNGDFVTLAGRVAPDMPAYTPEVYNPATGWRTLTGAASQTAFSNTVGGWYYPKAFVAPAGNVFIVANTGVMWSLDPTGAGAIASVAPATSVAPVRGSLTLPTIMYAPGKLLSLRLNKVVQLIDINGPQPVVTKTANIDAVRYWATATVLADGKVAVTGGSADPNTLTGVDYTTQIWDPATGTWTAGAVATKPRLYHSIALLLPDATLLTGAGGAPGPVNEYNAEVYYPPYLYLKDGSGQPAPRPTLVTAPIRVVIGGKLSASVGASDVISRVTLLRAGSVTHSTNIDQRFFDAPFTQSGTTLTVTPPTDPKVFVPGYYLMFVFQNGVPSVAKIIRFVPPAV